MNNTDIPSSFFDPKKDLKWLRNVSGTTRNKLYSFAALKAITLGKRGSEKESVTAGLSEAWKNLIGAMFTGF